jgi:hypothetical protein
MRKLRLTHKQADGVSCPHVAPADAEYIYIDGDGECWLNHRASLVNRKPEESGRAAWGPAKWEELHKWAIVVDLFAPRGLRDPQEWLNIFSRSLPCGECTMHWTKLLKELPPDFSSNDALFEWSVRAHNVVNRRLGKPEISVAEARARWQCGCSGNACGCTRVG